MQSHWNHNPQVLIWHYFCLVSGLKLDCSGEIVKVEVVDGGLICSSGVLVEEMGDKTDDCYIVNAAVYIGY